MRIPLMIVLRTASGNRAEATVYDYGKGDVGVQVSWEHPHTQADMDEANQIIIKHLGPSLGSVGYADQGSGPGTGKKSREAVQRFAATGDSGLPMKPVVKKP